MLPRLSNIYPVDSNKRPLTPPFGNKLSSNRRAIILSDILYFHAEKKYILKLQIYKIPPSLPCFLLDRIKDVLSDICFTEYIFRAISDSVHWCNLTELGQMLEDTILIT